jgi:hypothetical protein
MFVSLLAIIILWTVVPLDCRGQGMPHLVFGTAINNHLQPCQELSLSAWLVEYEDDTIDLQFTDGEFEVEVADFSHPWVAGEVLQIVLVDPQTVQSDTIGLVLNESPWQSLGFVHLEVIAIRFDNPASGEMQIGQTEDLIIRVQNITGEWSLPCCDYCDLETGDPEVVELFPFCRIEAVAAGECEISVSVYGATAQIERTVVMEAVAEGERSSGRLFSCASPVTGGELRLEVQSAPLELTLYDLLGRLVLQQTTTATGFWNLGTLPGSGTYILVGRRGEVIQREMIQLVR